MTKLTVKQFQDANNLSGPEASQFLKVLEGRGIISVAGKKRNDGQRGRAATVYNVDPKVLKPLKLEVPSEGVAEADIISD